MFQRPRLDHYLKLTTVSIARLESLHAVSVPPNDLLVLHIDNTGLTKGQAEQLRGRIGRDGLYCTCVSLLALTDKLAHLADDFSHFQQSRRMFCA